MIRTPPQHNTENPPGQIRPPRYLSDVIKRIQRDEEPMKLPTPIAGPAKSLADLVEALERACDVVEGDSAAQKRAWGGPGLLPQLRTSLIRRLIKENT